MTIISNSHKFVFVHLHKCGGSSVEAAYEPHASWNDLVIGSTKAGEQLQPIYQRLHGLQKHNSAADLREKISEVWDPYWTFSMVRHPARAYESFYKWIHKIVSNYAAHNDWTLDEVKEKIRNNEIDRPFMVYEVTKPFANATDFNDFVLRFMARETLGTMFGRLSDGENLIVDNVYKLENFDELWTALSERVGVDISPTHANKGSELSDFVWSDEAKKMLREKHSEDFERFGYL